MSKSVKTALITSAAIVAYSLIVFMAFGDLAKLKPADFQTMENLGYIRYVLIILGISVSVRWSAQDFERPNFKVLFKQGIVAALIIALGVGLMEAVYVWANPEFMSTYGAIMVEQAKLTGKSAAEIERMQAEMESFKWMSSPLGMGGFYFVETLFLCAVVGAISSFLVARTKK